MLYGAGPLPTHVSVGTQTLVVPNGGQWIITVIDPEMQLILKSSLINATLQGGGTIYIDTKEKRLINFDSDMTGEDKKKILPSFLHINGEQKFFDLSEQKDIIP